MVENNNRTPIPKSIWYSVIASYVSGILITISMFVYTNYIDDQSNRRWCTIVVTLDDTYKQTPPLTEVGKKIAESIHDLRIEFDC